MKTKSSGLFARLSRLNYPQKFTLISLLFILPLIAFYPVVAEQITRTRQYGDYELYGTYYLQPLQDLLEHVQEHNRVTINDSLELATPEQIDAVRGKIQQDFAQLEVYHAQYADELQLTSEFSDLKAQWTALVEDDLTTEAQISAAHLAVENSVQDLIRYVGDTSFLILDPELDTYYLMDAALLKLPKSQSLLNQIREIYATSVRNGSMTLNDSTLLRILTNELRDDLSALETTIAVSIRNNKNGQIAPVISEPLQDYLTTTNDLLNYIEETNQASLLSSANLSRLTELADQAQSTHASFYDAVSRALITGINGRISRYSATAYLPASVGLLSVLIGFWIGITIMRRISRPLSDLAQATEQMTQGDLSARVKITTEDEVGQVGQAFNMLGQTLQASQTRLVESAEVSRRLSTILDPRQLVFEVVEQVKTAFDYYHAHIYLLKEDGNTLEMVGGTGEAGQIMLERGHSISLERGLVGRAARTKLPVLAPDTANEPGWLPNPLLPETQAEIAVPIILGQTVLGVLDVQHNIVNGLTQEDAPLLLSIASQVAIALQNARQYGEIQANEGRLRGMIDATPTGVIITQIKDGLVLYANENAASLFGYRLEEFIGNTTPNLYYNVRDRDFVLNILSTEGRLSNYEVLGRRQDGTQIWVALSARTMIFGSEQAFYINATDITERKKTEEELAKRSERDRVLARIATKIRGAVSMDQVLQVATQEVRQATGATRSVVKIEPNEETISLQAVTDRDF